jgi:glycosyltransferase involved in cell wall biosynthesis
MDGVFSHVCGLCRHLLETGHQVNLAYSDRRSTKQLSGLVAEVEDGGGRTLNLRVTNAPEPQDLPALKQLRRFALESEPNVIHGHSSKAGVLVRILSFLGINVPVLYTPHAYFGLGGGLGARTVLYNAVESVLGRIGKAINAAADEAAFAQEVLRIPKHRLKVIPNGVDTQHYLPATKDQKATARKLLGLPAGAILVGSLGRLSYQKNPELMYRAFSKVLEKRSDVYLLHVGRGALEAQIEALGNELGFRHHLIRKRYLDDPRVFYQAIDAFLLTSRYETVALVSLEALSSGLPLILSRCPGMSEYFSADLSHLWSGESGDPASISEAILAWLADRNSNRPNNHRLIAQKHFSKTECFERVVTTYYNEIGSRLNRKATDFPLVGTI